MQHLIIHTSVKGNLEQNPGWFSNAAGLVYNHRFGFGLLNAESLVEAAKNHQNVNEQRNTADVSDGLSFHNDAFEVTPSNTGNSDVSDLIEEMNQDTITSLRNFVDSASQYHRKRRHSPNLYIHSTTASSITSSNDSITTSGGGKSASVHGDNNVIASSAASSNWRRLMPRKLSLRSKLASL